MVSNNEKKIIRQLRLGLALVLATMLLVSGCAPLKVIKIPPPTRHPAPAPAPAPIPAPAPKPAPAPAPAPAPTPTPSLLPAPEPPAPPAKTTGPAASLIEAGRKQLAAGQTDQAETTLERAIRIDPRNPLVWHTMAQVQYNQDNFAKAVQFCLKANTLLPPTSSLRRANWELLADAYQHLGEKAKAQEALAEAIKSGD